MAKKLADIEAFIKSKNESFFEFLKQVLDQDVFNFIESISQITNVYLFSGIIRNYFLENSIIRDVDIVIESDENFIELLNDYEFRVNSFGGYKIIINELTVDVWRMDKTWAFKNHQPVLDIFMKEYVPNTAFFNFSAVIYNINQKEFIYTKYFLRFLRDKKIDAVYIPNANYHLCVINSLYYSDKYNLKFSKKFTALVKQIHQKISKDYADIQVKHFGKILYTNLEIENRLKNLEVQD